MNSNASFPSSVRTKKIAVTAIVVTAFTFMLWSFIGGIAAVERQNEDAIRSSVQAARQYRSLQSQVDTAVDGMKASVAAVDAVDVEQFRVQGAASVPDILARRKLLQNTITDWQVQVIAQVQLGLKTMRTGVLFANVVPGGTTVAVFAPTNFAYYISAAVNAIPGVLLAVLGFIIGCFYWCYRGCRCCGCRVPKEDGYSNKERYIPVFLLTMLTLGVGVATFFATTGNQALGGGLDNIIALPANVSTDLLSRVDAVATQLNSFTTVVNTGVANMRLIVSGLPTIPPIISSMAVDLSNISTAFTNLSTTMTLLNANLTSVQEDMSALNSAGVSAAGSITVPTIPSSTFTLITSAGNTAASTSSQVVTLAASLNTSVNSLASTVNNNIDSLASTAINTLNSTSSQVSSIGTSIRTISNQITSYSSMATFYNTIRFWVMLAPFIFLCALFFFASWCGWMQKCGCICCAQWQSCCLGFWGVTLWFFVWLFFSICFVIAIILGGACADFIPNLFEQSIIPLSSDLRIKAQNLTHCSGTGNLFTIFGVDNLLNITNTLNVNSLFDANSINNAFNTTAYLGLLDQFSQVGQLNLSGLFATSPHDVAAQVRTLRDSLNISDFGGNTTGATNNLNDLNALTQADNGDTWALSNISSLVVSTYSSGIQSAVSSLKAKLVAYNVIVATYQEGKSNLTRVSTKLDAAPAALDQAAALNVQVNDTNAAVRAKVLQASAKSQELSTNLTNSLSIVNTLQSSIDVVRNLGQCAWIGAVWTNVQTSVCVSLLGGFDMLWFGYLMVGIFLFPGMILACVGATRNGRSPEHMAEELGDIAAGDDIPMKPIRNRGPSAVDSYYTQPDPTGRPNVVEKPRSAAPQGDYNSQMYPPTAYNFK